MTRVPIIDEKTDKIPESLVDNRSGLSCGVRKLDVSYGGVHAVRNATFTIAPGERVAFIGNNGAGKTTLCNVITGLTAPTQGEVLINDKIVTKKNTLWRARAGVRRIFENPVVYNDLSIEENVMVGAPMALGDGIFPSLFFPRMFHRDKRNTARRLMQYCNIDPQPGVAIKHLPYVTKKRVELARALMGNPRILILDEPAASMSENERSEYCQVIQDYSETFSTTVLVVEHDLEFVRALCQRAIVIDAGEIVADGPMIPVLHDKDTMASYFGKDPSA